MVKHPTKRHSRRPGEKVHSDWRKQRHSVDLQSLVRPKKEKWFHTEGSLKGWKADQAPSTRMTHLREAQKSRGHGKITPASKLSVMRALIALANVTKDKETRISARHDAKILRRQYQDLRPD